MMPAVAHREGHVTATTDAAGLPVTAGGEMNAVNALPAILLPPIPVRFSARSAATPAGAVASMSAGNAVDPATLARTASVPGDMFTHGDAAKLASAVAKGEVGSAEVPPVADAYTSSADAPAPAFTTRNATLL